MAAYRTDPPCAWRLLLSAFLLLVLVISAEAAPTTNTTAPTEESDDTTDAAVHVLNSSAPDSEVNGTSAAESASEGMQQVTSDTTSESSSGNSTGNRSSESNKESGATGTHSGTGNSRIATGSRATGANSTTGTGNGVNNSETATDTPTGSYKKDSETETDTTETDSENRSTTHTGNNATESFTGNNATEIQTGGNARESFTGSNATESSTGSNATKSFIGRNTTESQTGSNVSQTHTGSNATITDTDDTGIENATDTKAGNKSITSGTGSSTTGTPVPKTTSGAIDSGTGNHESEFGKGKKGKKSPSDETETTSGLFPQEGNSYVTHDKTGLQKPPVTVASSLPVIDDFSGVIKGGAGGEHKTKKSHLGTDHSTNAKENEFTSSMRTGHPNTRSDDSAAVTQTPSENVTKSKTYVTSVKAEISNQTEADSGATENPLQAATTVQPPAAMVNDATATGEESSSMVKDSQSSTSAEARTTRKQEKSVTEQPSDTKVSTSTDHPLDSSIITTPDEAGDMETSDKSTGALVTGNIEDKISSLNNGQITDPSMARQTTQSDLATSGMISIKSVLSDDMEKETEKPDIGKQETDGIQLNPTPSSDESVMQPQTTRPPSRLTTSLTVDGAPTTMSTTKPPTSEENFQPFTGALEVKQPKVVTTKSGEGAHATQTEPENGDNIMDSHMTTSKPMKRGDVTSNEEYVEITKVPHTSAGASSIQPSSDCPVQYCKSEIDNLKSLIEELQSKVEVYASATYSLQSKMTSLERNLNNRLRSSPSNTATLDSPFGSPFEASGAPGGPFEKCMYKVHEVTGTVAENVTSTQWAPGLQDLQERVVLGIECSTEGGESTLLHRRPQPSFPNKTQFRCECRGVRRYWDSGPTINRTCIMHLWDCPRY